MKHLAFKNYGMTVHSVVCLFVLVSMLIFPPLAIAYLIKNFDKLQSKAISRKFGKAYDELNLKKGRKVFI